MTNKVNPNEKFALFTDQWSLKLVGQVNDMHAKLVRIEGDSLRHSHETEDEMSFVIEGNMTMHFRDRDAEGGPGEFIIVPHGVSTSRPVSGRRKSRCSIPATTVNTGSEDSKRTREVECI